MDLKTYFQTTALKEREEFAKTLDVHQGYLYRCSRNERLPGPKLCVRMVELDPRFSLAELRPDIWGSQVLETA